MSNIPSDLKYTRTHEWVRMEANGVAVVGISDHAQELLGDLVFVELPEVGATLDAEEECAVVESVKAASDIYCPVSGEIVEVNEALIDAPEIINGDAYEDGWLLKIRLSDETELDSLMNAEAYTEMAEADEH